MTSRRTTRIGAALRTRVAEPVCTTALAVFVAYAVLEPPGPAFPGPPAAAWAVAILVAGPMLVRRRRPLGVLTLVATVAVFATAAGVAGAGALWAPFLPAAVALHTVATTASRRVAVAALAIVPGCAAVAVALYYAAHLPPLIEAAPSEVPLWAPGEAAVTVIVLVAFWTAGRFTRWRREAAARLAQSQSRAAVADERLRIARDLHDVISHSMSLISVKATVANHLADSRPDEVRAALAVIEQTSRTALRDMRGILGLLRADDDEPVDLAPPVGIAQVPDLVAQARSAGLRVDLRTRGLDGLPESTGLTLYRIVQEALTNVIRHAGPTGCRVSIEADDGTVRIDVTDDGPAEDPVPAGAPGHGLAGMRERVAVHGGSVTAAPLARGFRVRAELPYQPVGGPA